MADAYRRFVSFHREHCKMSTADAAAKIDEPISTGQTRRILNAPPERGSWLDLQSLAERDADRATERWERIKKAARDELASGHRAAKAMEPTHGTPWKRAQFLAVRDALAAEWRPRTGIEWTLIDVLAQAHSSYLFWQERFVMLATLESDNDAIKESGYCNSPRVEDAEAVNQAAAMCDRFNRLFCRTLRALRDLRRHAPTLIVQNVGQMNVAEHQTGIKNRQEVRGREASTLEQARLA
jgi:hypothetical protein